MTFAIIYDLKTQVNVIPIVISTIQNWFGVAKAVRKWPGSQLVDKNCISAQSMNSNFWEDVFKSSSGYWDDASGCLQLEHIIYWRLSRLVELFWISRMIAIPNSEKQANLDRSRDLFDPIIYWQNVYTTVQLAPYIESTMGLRPANGSIGSYRGLCAL